MTIEYTWKIVELERNTVDGGVAVAHWDLTGNDVETSTSARIYGTCSFTPDATDPNFVTFDSLTESDVLAWIWASEDFGKETKELSITDQINAKNNPVVSKGLPW